MTDVSNNGARPGDERPVLTNRQGHPVYDNQNQRTVGARDPATLENYQFLEKISHFDRERIPERVVHARGVTAHGFFEAYEKWGDEPVAAYTRAKLFQERGRRTPIALRFSTVIGGRDSAETARDPRGFAIKFYTEDGNWDLVGNNLAVFFIRDAIKFPDVIHALKPDPVTFSQCARPVQERMVWHFLLVEDDLGLRVGEGLGIGPDGVAHLEPLPGQDLTDEDRRVLGNLGKNGTRDVAGLKMTHCVPNERAVHRF